ncbi:MAG TPA: hypothetical protein VNG90_03255, partial [Candidatus Acidoferrum sp.]|nr:hypothetical protein [Candidatus Acidoferrum sp.]
MTDPVAVQIGGGRNGQNPYKAVCQKFGLQFWLVETPEFIDLQGRQGYTLPHNLIALPEAHVPEAVLRTLSQRGIQPFIVMPGFERYGLCAAKVSEKLNCLPYGQFPFLPRNKQEQKNLLDDVFPHTASLTADDFAANERLLDNLSFPVVIKPFDGAGGLGVYLADDLAAVKTALGLLEHTANYGGGEFDGILIEEFVPGPEQSVQGVVIGGKVHTLSMGTKLVFKEPIAPGLAQFREAGLVLVGPSH